MLNREKKEIIVYNQKNFSIWETELKTLPQQQQHQQNIIKQQNDALLLLLDEDKALRSQIAPLETSQQALKSSISALEFEDFTDTVEHGQGKNFSLLDLAKDMNRSSQLSNLQEALSKTEKALNPLLQKRKLLTQTINHHKEKKYTADMAFKKLAHREQILESQLQKGKIFFYTLDYKPSELLQNLNQDINHVLNYFEEIHPDQQSILLRQSILEIQQHKEAILDKEESKPELIRLQYHSLCGLLGTIYFRLENSINLKNRELANLIFQMIEKTHINVGGDLPDSFKTNFQNTFYYRQSFKAISVEELKAYEDNKFKTVCDNFNQDLLKINRTTTAIEVKNMVDKGFNLITDLNTKKIKTPDQFDIHFAISIIQHAHALLKPHDASLHDSCQRLADLETVGRPSGKKKAGGLLMAFVGTVIIVGSVLAAVASFGAASPLSTVGITVGVTLLAKSLSISIGIIGVSTALVGCGFFKHGMRKGISKDITTYESSHNECKHLGLAQA